MVILNQEDYEKLASQVAEEYHATGTPLNDAIYKLATEMGLNGSQIKNVCWAANTKVHLDLFEKKAEDKIIEFQVSDPEYIIKRLYTPQEMQPLPEKVAEAAALDFFSPLAPVTEKIANEEFPVEEKPVSEKTAADRKAKSVIAARKIAEELELRRLKTAHEANDILSSLAWDIRKIGFDRAEFEKDAVAMYGEEAIMPINWLRQLAHAEQTDITKLASTYERVVDMDAPEMEKFSEVINKLAEVKKYMKAIAWFKDKVGANG